MTLFSLIGIEFHKIRRSGIIMLLAVAAIILWLPSIMNADLNFGMQAEGISPENNFLVQGFLGVAWFMFPASMVVGTVLLHQTERANNGIMKMLALPVSMKKLCFAKFVVLAALSAMQMLMMVGMYYISAAVAGHTQGYSFALSFPFVCKVAALLFLAGIPMLSVFWLLSVCIRTPVFAVGAGLALIVPSVLIINTKAWVVYPMAYPLYMMTIEYGKLAANLSMPEAKLFPWLPIAVFITVVCLLISCLYFGQTERG